MPVIRPLRGALRHKQRVPMLDGVARAGASAALRATGNRDAAAGLRAPLIARSHYRNRPRYALFTEAERAERARTRRIPLSLALLNVPSARSARGTPIFQYGTMSAVLRNSRLLIFLRRSMSVTALVT